MFDMPSWDIDFTEITDLIFVPMFNGFLNLVNIMLGFWFHDFTIFGVPYGWFVVVISVLGFIWYLVTGDDGSDVDYINSYRDKKRKFNALHERAIYENVQRDKRLAMIIEKDMRAAYAYNKKYNIRKDKSHHDAIVYDRERTRKNMILKSKQSRSKSSISLKHELNQQLRRDSHKYDDILKRNFKDSRG